MGEIEKKDQCEYIRNAIGSSTGSDFLLSFCSCDLLLWCWSSLLSSSSSYSDQSLINNWIGSSVLSFCDCLVLCCQLFYAIETKPALQLCALRFSISLNICIDCSKFGQKCCLAVVADVCVAAFSALRSINEKFAAANSGIVLRGKLKWLWRNSAYDLYCVGYNSRLYGITPSSVLSKIPHTNAFWNLFNQNKKRESTIKLEWIRFYWFLS